MPRVSKKIDTETVAPGLDITPFLSSPTITRHLLEFAPAAVIFSQGDQCDGVMYIQKGAVKLSVVSHGGKEAIVAVFGPGDFLGEGALAAQCIRLGTATAVSPTTVLAVTTEDMHQLLQSDGDFSSGFIQYMLARNIRVEEDLIDQLFNSSEKRLARALLLVARYGMDERSTHGTLPRLSQEMLAEMIGATRSRVNFFMNKFRRLGFIDYNNNGGIRINFALLSIALHDKPSEDTATRAAARKRFRPKRRSEAPDQP